MGCGDQGVEKRETLKAFNCVKFHVARAFANREYEAAEEARKIMSRDRGDAEVGRGQRRDSQCAGIDDRCCRHVKMRIVV